MPGLFSRMGTYMAGAAKMAEGVGAGHLAQLYAGAGKGASMLAKSSAVRGAMAGGLAGGALGAMSDDTSVIGGALEGAALGAAAGRYAHAGMRSYLNTSKRGVSLASNMRAASGAVMNLAKADYRGAMMSANQGVNRIRGLGRAFRK